MRFVSFRVRQAQGLGVEANGAIFGLLSQDPAFPGELHTLLSAGEDLVPVAQRLLAGEGFDTAELAFDPPIRRPGKIVCVGLNYIDHALETGFAPPTSPEVFVRFASSLIGHGGHIQMPTISHQLDFEGEIAAIVGKGGYAIAESEALDHIAGYSIFNDVTVRDIQFRTSQWTLGKNFNGTGCFGPSFVTADELPPGLKGVSLTTRLNGAVVQQAPADDMVFGVSRLVSLLSEVFTLEPGDVIVTGTPPGVGFVRTPPLWMKPGDLCEVEVDGLGALTNRVAVE